MESGIPPAAPCDQGAFIGPDGHPTVAVIVVTYNSADDIDVLIAELRVAAIDVDIRLIVVDNQSSDGTVDLMKAHADVVLVEPGGNLGYAGGINAAKSAVGDSEYILILNPDLRLGADAIPRMIAAAADDGVGGVVPLMLDDDGTISFSLCREPTIMRSLGAALVGSRIRKRPAFTSEFEFDLDGYQVAHDVDWATGAALLVPARVAHEVGDWNEDFFLYSEEVDYCRRIRMSGRTIRFEPSARVSHRGAGSGTSPALSALKSVNRIHYVELYHGRVYSALFRFVVALGEGLRFFDPVHRSTFAVVVNRRRWRELPTASKAPSDHARSDGKPLTGAKDRGSVIIPAYDEAAVIERTLEPLSEAAAQGYLDVIVVCNGCTDDTAERARGVAGIRVVELAQGSKPGALNAGDAAARLWPRLYLDADVSISADAVIAVLDRLGDPDVLTASPGSRHDASAATHLVRRYYSARDRIVAHKSTMWSAGAYGLNQAGHDRIGHFPDVTADDLYVDVMFDSSEKAIVADAVSSRETPRDAASLLTVLRRHHRGVGELAGAPLHGREPVADTGKATALAVLGTVRGVGSALDAVTYLAMAVAARAARRRGVRWERDDSTRAVI